MAETIVKEEFMCRLCLAQGDDMHSIFSEDDRESIVPLSDRIMSCASILVARDDGLPDCICQKCMQSVHNSYKFRKQCESSDAVLRIMASKKENESSQLKVTSDDNYKEFGSTKVDSFKSNQMPINNELIALSTHSQTGSSNTCITVDNKIVEVDSCSPGNKTGMLNGASRLELSEATVNNEAAVETCSQDGTDDGCVDTVAFSEEELEETQFIEDQQTSGGLSANDFPAELGFHTEQKPEQKLTTIPRKMQLNESEIRRITANSSFSVQSTNTRSQQHHYYLDYKCYICPESFVELSSLSKHLNLHVEKLTCMTCKKVLDDVKCLRMHSKTHVRGKMHTNSPMSGVTEGPCKTYRCYICNLSLTDLGTLSKHINLHVEKLTCPICKAVLWDENSFKVHEKSHLLECEKCNSLFPSLDALVQHEKGHRFSCSVCKEVFSDKALFIVHKEMRHLNCSICKEIFPNQHALVVHRKTHMFQCAHCDHLFSDKNVLINHLKVHMQPESAPTLSGKSNALSCSVCKKVFPDQNTLTVHERKHKLLCMICKELFSDRCSLIVHEKIHTFPCPVCKKIFHNRKALTHHEKNHMLKCVGCDELLPDKEALAIHVKAHVLPSLVVKKEHTDLDVSATCGRKGSKDRNSVSLNKFTCSKCRKTFRDQSSLSDHAKTHLFPCPTCKKVFSDQNNLKAHEKTHATIQTFTCNICKMTFSDKSEFKLHKNSHTSDRPYVCNFCDIGFHNCSELNDHLKTHGLTAVKCYKCSAEFSDMLALQEHLKKHGGNNKCRFCSADFLTLYDLDMHLIQKHRELMNYTCDICNETFDDEIFYDIHIKGHLCGGAYRCYKCDQEFTCMKSLKHHLEHHAVVKKSYKCSVCKQDFYTQLVLNTHMIVHEQEGNFGCLLCSLKFKTKHQLAIHEKTHKAKAGKCSICEEVFASRLLLARHYEFHKIGSLYKCPKCSETFQERVYLVSHIKLHADFKCKMPACEAGFSKPSDLESHISEVHKNGSLYKCHKCSKTFKHKRNLVTHIRLHKLTCVICEAEFPKASLLVSHIASHSEQISHKCSHCNQSFKSSEGLQNHSCNSAQKGEKSVVKSVSKPFCADDHIYSIKREIYYDCRKCRESFELQSELNEHNFKKHSTSYQGLNLKCPECSESFKLTRQLKAHLLKHSKVIKKTNISAPIANLQPSVLIRKLPSPQHMKEEGRKGFLRTHACSECSKSFYRRASLGSHIRFFHNQGKIKPFT